MQIWQTCVLVDIGLTRSECASWVQAWGSVLAIVVTAGAVWLAHFLENRRAAAMDAAVRRRRGTTLLLSLQILASELKRMIVLANFQLDAPGNPLIYADIAGEFAAMAQLFDKLPIDEVVEMEKMDSVLMLRRIATELALMYKASAPVQGDRFYLRNRERFSMLEGQCGACSLALADEIKSRDPMLYASHEASMLRM